MWVCPVIFTGYEKCRCTVSHKKLISRIKFTIGLFCGTNKSYRATEQLIAVGTEIPLENIAKFEYRSGPESQDRKITMRDGKTEIIPRRVTAGFAEQMRRDRCNWCWDFSAELSDVSVGDIFLPIEYIRLPKVTSIITRTELGDMLIDGAEESDYIRTSPLVESGFSYNVGLNSKKRLAARHLIERKGNGLLTPDYHYVLKHEPPILTDVKAAVLEQMKDIPEIVEWVARSPWLQKKLAAVDPEILQVIEQLPSTESQVSY
ncbi:Coenzyme F420 hydrogenase/dehydrogenase, beta subunit C-terminal domain [Chloroflexota bacterium]